MKNGNMPAMPQTGTEGTEGDLNSPEFWGGVGLTKREHFAGLAMQGFIAGSVPGDNRTIDEASSLAVKFADALLKELDK